MGGGLGVGGYFATTTMTGRTTVTLCMAAFASAATTNTCKPLSRGQGVNLAGKEHCSSCGVSNLTQNPFGGYMGPKRTLRLYKTLGARMDSVNQSRLRRYKLPAKDLKCGARTTVVARQKHTSPFCLGTT